MSVVLVTGADGFIGSRFCALLEQRGHAVRRVVRSGGKKVNGACIEVGDLASYTGWSELVNGIDVVTHLAGRAHVVHKSTASSDSLFRAVNVDVTTRLATAAAQAQVRRFIFMSSIGVNGNKTFGRPFTESDPAAPAGEYATSKWEAERALTQISSRTGMEVTLIRPPLVYGPGVKGNLQRLLKLSSLGLPLPLGALRAPRSFVGLDNLCDLVCRCVAHPDASGVFLAAEPERRSSAELLELIAEAMGRRHQVWRWPLPILELIALATGRRAELQKLEVPLEVDASKAKRILGWQPHVNFVEGVREMVASYEASSQ